MSEPILVVDGMLSGTGVRDGINGGYLDLHRIGISDILQRRIQAWLLCYEDAHYRGFDNKAECASLDQQGVELAGMIKAELPEATVTYFSSAAMKAIGVG